MFPLEKYRFYTNGNKVVAVSTYAGKTVRGVAKCAPEDTFDLEKGKEIAAARCAVRIAQKRYARADQKAADAYTALENAKDFSACMDDYLYTAGQELMDTQDHLASILANY